MRTIKRLSVELPIRIFSLTPALQLANLTANKGAKSRQNLVPGIWVGKKNRRRNETSRFPLCGMNEVFVFREGSGENEIESWIIYWLATTVENKGIHNGKKKNSHTSTYL